MTTLDCGHPPDAGKPYTPDGKLGWQFVVRGERKICHACDSQRTLDCGHQPSPHSEYTTGTAHMPDGREVCWECSYAGELESLKTADRYMAYLTQRPEGGYELTTWPGQPLARITEWNKAKVGGFGGMQERIYWRAIDVHGARWYGTSPGVGMFARMRRAKQ